MTSMTVEVFELVFPLYAVDCFEVVLVLDLCFRVGVEDRVVHRKRVPTFASRRFLLANVGT